MSYILHMVMAQNLGPLLLSPHLILTLLFHALQPVAGLTAHFESLIVNLLCFSHPCSAVFIFCFEPLWPSQPHRPMRSQHYLFFFSHPPRCDCPGRSCAGAYLLVVHVPRVLTESACSSSADVLFYDISHIRV